MKMVLYNANVIYPDRIVYHGGIEIQDGLISKVFSEEDYDHEAKCLDCKRNYLSPGFIDIHMHGGGGSDFIDGTEKAINTVIKTHAKYGITSCLATTVSAPIEKVIQALKEIERVQNQRKSGPKILGSHIEGNFFSMKQKGAQNPEYIFAPTEDKFRPMVDSVSNIKRISCAPELENALEFAKEMVGRGIVMSVAHSDATYPEFALAVENGFSHITHIYNGNSWLKSPYYYCQIGACEGALLIDDVYVEVIADGKHLPKELLRLIYKVKGSDRMQLCTDSMCAAALPPGKYALGGLPVMVEDGVAMLEDRSSFAGSVCTGDRAIRTIYHDAGIPLQEAVKMYTVTPARILGLFDKMGSVTIGKAADINVFDENINIKFTLIDGQIYNNSMFETTA